MANDFQQLLEAAIHHLENLKDYGTRFVRVSPQTLQTLSQSPIRSATMSSTTSQSAGYIPVVGPPRNATVDAGIAPRCTPSGQAPARAITTKHLALGQLREGALACTRCPNLARSRTQVVFGVGNPNAELMFVGEAPGADEDAQGEPFVGRAGQLLNKIIETMGLSRDQVYIANILKCRPDMPPGAPGNRKPTPPEMETCIPWLLDQINIIQPKVMVALGATAVEGLLGGKVSISQRRGQWLTLKGIPLMPTFHPSYLLRGHDITKKRMVWEDMLQVMEKLGMPITSKHRGFFLIK
jgi:DNA polymerase